MSSLACVAAEVNESTGSAFLIAFQQHAAAMGFFRPIADRLRVKMKAVRYSVLQNGQTLVASILLGCPYTSSINHRLVPDSVAAREWGMERFPDQSQVNLFLNRMTAENVAQLEQSASRAAALALAGVPLGPRQHRFQQGSGSRAR
jgi:hypothetical protein